MKVENKHTSRQFSGSKDNTASCRTILVTSGVRSMYFNDFMNFFVL